MECIILGNGPSLLSAVLPPLPVYGCNYIGKLLQPDFYCAFDRTVIAHDDLIYPTAKAAKVAYLRDFNSCDHKPAPLYALPHAVLVNKKSFVFQGESSPTGSSTLYMMLKIAFFSGFRRVYLYGVDHTTSHFSTDWPAGVQPSLDGRIKHYQIAASEYARVGGVIINRSAPSILDTIFSRENTY